MLTEDEAYRALSRVSHFSEREPVEPLLMMLRFPTASHAYGARGA